MVRVFPDDNALGRGLEAAPGGEAAVAARLRDEVAGRLRRACAAMAPDLFARVVDAVVARRIRWARREVAARPPARD